MGTKFKQESKQKKSMTTSGHSIAMGKSSFPTKPLDSEKTPSKNDIKQAHEFFQRALLAMQKNEKMDSILSSLSQASKLMPQEALYVFHLGLAYHRMEKRDKASEYYQKALDLDPKNPRYLYHFLLLRLQQGKEISEFIPFLPIQDGFLLNALYAMLQRQYEQAIDSLKAITEIAPEHPCAFFLLGLGYLATGKPVQASEAMEKAQSILPKESILGLYHAQLLALTRRGEGTETTLKAFFSAGFKKGVLRKQLNSIYLNQAKSALEGSDNEKAISSFQNLLELNSGNQRFREALSMLFLAKGNAEAKTENYKQAIEIWEEALKLDPENHKAIHNIALAYDRMEKPKQANVYWKKLIQSWKKELPKEQKDLLAVAYRRIADNAVNMGLYHDVVQNYTKALEILPDHRETHKMLLDIYMSEDKWKRAQKHVTYLYEHGGEQDAEVLCQMGIISGEIGELNAGESFLRKSLAIFPDNPVAKNALQTIFIKRSDNLLAKRDYKGAIQTLESIFTFKPNEIYIHFKIGQIYLKMSDSLKAQTSFEKALESQLHFVIPILSIVTECVEANDRNMAETFLEKGIEMFRNDSYSLFMLGQCYLSELHDLDQAIQTFKKILNQDLNLGDLSLLLDIAENLMKYRQWDDAIPFLKKAIENDPNQTEPYMFMGICYSEKMERQQSKAYFQKALDLAKKEGNDSLAFDLRQVIVGNFRLEPPKR